MCAGGITENINGICETTTLCYLYDSTSDNWTQFQSMNDNRISFCLINITGNRATLSVLTHIATAGRIYAIGGRNNEADMDSIEFYDETKNGWALSSFKLIQPAACYASVVIDSSS